MHRVLVGKSEGRRPLEKPRRRLEDNIKMYFRDAGCGACIRLMWLMIDAGGGVL